MAFYNKLIMAGKFYPKNDGIKTVGGNGSKLLNFSLAFKAKFAKPEDDMMFINCSAWGKTAEFLHKYCKKNDDILIEGSLKIDQKRENPNQQWTTFNVDLVELLRKPGNGNGSAETVQKDDIPW